MFDDQCSYTVTHSTIFTWAAMYLGRPERHCMQGTSHSCR